MLRDFIRISFYFVIILFNLSCNRLAEKKDIENHLKVITSMNTGISVDDWQTNTFSFLSGENYIYYHLTKQKYDTSYSLEIIKYDTAKTYFLVEYSKVFKDSEKMHFLTINLESDTILYYVRPLLDSLNMVFIIGKYKYMAEHFELNYNQYLYYLRHKDSLSQIRGHNIPTLPQLEDTSNYEDTIDFNVVID